ncbi:MAG: hypothetical protein ACRD23_16605 [Terriglobales bacterium]
MRTIQGPQIGVPASITIDSSNNKYILDFSTNSIHVLNASDQLSTNLNLSTPSASGTLRIAGDGTLMLTVWLSGQRIVKKLATDGTELFSVTYLTSDFIPSWATADSKGNMFLAGNNQVKVLGSNGIELGNFDLNVSSAPPCGLDHNGDTIYVCYLNRISSLSAE